MIDDPADGKFTRTGRIRVEFEKGRAIPCAIGVEAAEADASQDHLGILLASLRVDALILIANVFAEPKGLVLQNAVAIVLRVAVGGEPVPIAQVMGDTGLTEPLTYQM